MKKITELEKEFIKSMKTIRIAKNLSQDELAKKAGVSRLSIILLENQQRKPSEKLINKLVNTLSNEYLNKLAKNIISESQNNNEIDYSGYEFKPVPISDKIITSKEDINNIGNKTATVFIPGQIASRISLLKDVYAYKMPDNSMSPEFKKGDFVIIKYVNNLKPEEVDEFNRNDFFVALNCGLIRKIHKIIYHENNTFETFKTMTFLIPLDDSSVETEFSDYGRLEDYNFIDNRTFLLNKKSDIKICGIVIAKVAGNYLDEISLDLLIKQKWFK